MLAVSAEAGVSMDRGLFDHSRDVKSLYRRSAPQCSHVRAFARTSAGIQEHEEVSPKGWIALRKELLKKEIGSLVHLANRNVTLIVVSRARNT